MTADTVYTRTFRRAIETIGGAQRLARALGASVEEIKDWAEGHKVPPPGAFLAAIDIVARAGLGTMAGKS
jgi:hypothetical protein